MRFHLFPLASAKEKRWIKVFHLPAGYWMSGKAWGSSRWDALVLSKKIKPPLRPRQERPPVPRNINLILIPTLASIMIFPRARESSRGKRTTRDPSLFLYLDGGSASSSRLSSQSRIYGLSLFHRKEARVRRERNESLDVRRIAEWNSGWRILNASLCFSLRGASDRVCCKTARNSRRRFDEFLSEPMEET